MRVSLNIDVGEVGEVGEIGEIGEIEEDVGGPCDLALEPEELYALATQVNIACGAHAGGAESMRRACRLAVDHGCAIAAHPGYPDRAGMGRRSLPMSIEAIRATVADQCAALRDAMRAIGGGITLSRVKPHGALYHDAARQDAIARAVVGAALDALNPQDVLGGEPGAGKIGFVGPPTSRLAEAVARERRAFSIAEGFADRTYDPSGELRPRSEPGALVTDPRAAAEQAVALARSGRFQTICVHGDTPGAVAIAREVRAALEADGLLS